MPWTSDTTAMMEVTATMFPSTVRNDRSLYSQIARSAMAADSRNWPMCLLLGGGGPAARRGFDLHGRAVAQLAHRAERPDDHLIAGGHARQPFEILFAGDAGLDRREDRLVPLDDEDAFELLPLLARLQLLRLDGRARAALGGLRVVADDVAVLVDHHLAHRRRLDRDPDDLRAGRRRDFGRAGEARPNLGDRLVDLHLDEEVGRLRRRGRAGGLERAVADLDDVAGERLVLDRVDGDLRLLADLDVGDVGLVDFDLRFDQRHVGDRQQHRARVVHRPDHDRLALFDVAARDDALDRRLDADLAQVVLGVLERRLLLLHAIALDFDLPIGRVGLCLLYLELVLGVVERFLRRQPALPELLLARVVVLRRLQRRLAAVGLHAQLLHRRARRRQRGFRLIHLAREVARIDLEQELPPIDALAFLDGEVRHAAHRVGADVDRPLRLDLARRRDDRLQIPLLDGFDVDGDARLTLELEIGEHDRAEDHHDPDA